MPKVLNISCKTLLNKLLVLSSLFIGNTAFAQYGTKQLVTDKVKSIKTTEFYTYNRTGDSYDGLSISTEQVGTGATKAVYKIDLIYTNTSALKPSKITFINTDDGAMSISVPIDDDGTQYVDNSKFHSNKFHIQLTDSTLATLSKLQVKNILLSDENGQKLATLEVSNPSFLSQQFTSIQNALKPKPAPKKPVKRRPSIGTRAH